MVTDRPLLKTCPHCGGDDILSGVELGMNAEAGGIGLQYKAGMLLVGTEKLFADLCRGCGTVTRFFVKNIDRKWIVK